MATGTDPKPVKDERNDTLDQDLGPHAKEKAKVKYS